MCTRFPPPRTRGAERSSPAPCRQLHHPAGPRSSILRAAPSSGRPETDLGQEWNITSTQPLIPSGDQAPGDRYRYLSPQYPAPPTLQLPKGARIVEENGVTYRIGADNPKIVVEKGVRYRVDSSGTRVKINDQGLDIDLPDLTPDVDIGTNEKGNPDIDVKGHKDGDKVPN